METVINNMLDKYKLEFLNDKKNTLKEISQEIFLASLSRTNFFNHAAFYGGTALRIFHGLDRFSEDLDFSLVSKDESFDLKKYFQTIKNEFNALGFNFEIEEKEKEIGSNIKSAFLKGNTKEHIISLYNESDGNNVHRNEIIKIKFEVDVNPPAFATFENNYALLPFPYQIRLYDMPSLFAGKIHAILCRNWKNRVKGRDYYDYVFYLSLGSKVNIKHLKERLIESGCLKKEEDFNIEILKKMLNHKFNEVDYNQAKEDVLPFIKDKSKLDLWSKDFFKEITKNIKEN